MNGAADRQTGGRWLYAGLPDVTGMSLSTLLTCRGVLADALNRVAREAATKSEPISAFGSYAKRVDEATHPNQRP